MAALRAGWGCLLLLAALALPARAATPPPAAALRQVASGPVFPVELADPGDGSGRLFIAEQGGRILVARNGRVSPAPFLDLTSRIAQGGERGLLGLAFDPAFAANRRFFAFYTMAPSGDLRVSSFLASAADPDLADAASELEVLTIPHSAAANHNGGHLAFGPDGYLYIGTGDGGGAGDPLGNGQNLATLLGKLLRLDVSGSGGYAIPPDNPAYAGVPGARREVWAYGLRNPWRFSFDRATGDLYIGDVGQNLIEEVDYVPAGSPGGINFGWPVFEGTACFGAASCGLPNHTPPVLRYAHAAEGGFSITGGFVYRGSAFPALRGYYLYADYVTGRVWAATHEAGVWSTFVLFEPPRVFAPSTFGQDANGEIYLARHAAVGGIDVIIPVDTAVPGAPLPISPTGTLATASPTYRWSAVPGAASYQLLVQNTAGVRLSASFGAVEAGCPAGSGTCAAVPVTQLAGNTPYSWFVRATNSLGTGPWSEPAPIFVSSAVAGGPPPAPTLISPAGTLLTARPTYAWNPAAGATSYWLLVQNTAGVAVSRSFTAAAAGCAAAPGPCMATPAETLAPNTPFVWFVNASNAQGTSAWSAGLAIAASGSGGPPAVPVAMSPTGTLSTLTPTYAWNAVPGAISYYLLVQNTAGVAVSLPLDAAAAGCPAGTGMCTFAPAQPLAPSTPYAWFVNATGLGGTSAWSGGLMIRTP
jgi:glucose/arabinose dehydrogenase